MISDVKLLLLFMKERRRGFYAQFDGFGDETLNKRWFEMLVLWYCLLQWRRIKSSLSNDSSGNRRIKIKPSALWNAATSLEKESGNCITPSLRPQRDHLSQLGKRITCSTNISLNVKYYTNQSAIPQFILCKGSTNFEERRKQEIKMFCCSLQSQERPNLESIKVWLVWWSDWSNLTSLASGIQVTNWCFWEW